MTKYDAFVGKILDERYKITSVVGIGGMAVVFKAEDIIMKREVAIKVLKADTSNNERAMQRFLNESTAVAMLSHPNIVNIYDVNVKDEVKYIVMEYVESTTLKDYLAKVQRIGWKEALDYTKQILSALSHAHSKGVVHRDVKPQNMLLLRDGTIKVADFGIAKVASNETITDGKNALGTVHYISPEQANGKDVTPESDIYSVGVMLYEMVTGRLPFDAEAPVSIALKHITDEAVPPKDIIPTLPDGLQFIIMQAMAKNKNERFESCKEMLRYIDELIENPDVMFAPLPPRHSGNQTAQEESNVSNPHRKKETQIKAKKHRNTMMPIIFGVFLAFLIVGVFSGIKLFKTLWSITWSANDDKNTELVAVENLVGKEYSKELSDELYEKGYRLTVKNDYNKEYEENIIYKQSVAEGERRRPGFSITVWVSKGEHSFVLEDYKNSSQKDVVAALRAMGAIIKIEEAYDDFVPEDCVISTKPAAGSTILDGDTVTITVSKGIEVKTATVPVLTMMPLANAKKLIAENNFTLGEVEEVYSNVQKGYVVKQSVAAGSDAPEKFTVIDLEVSKGRDPNEPVEETPVEGEN